MKKLIIIYNIFGIPAHVLHELSHYVMGAIVGARFRSIHILIESTDYQTFNCSGTVWNQCENKFQAILISSAPSIFLIVSYVLCLMVAPLLAIYLGIYWYVFWISKTDYENIKHHLGFKSTLHTCTDEELFDRSNNIRNLAESSMKKSIFATPQDKISCQQMLYAHQLKLLYESKNATEADSVILR